MNNNIESLIKNNFSILTALFHITENSVKVINDKKRIFTKDIYTNRILESIPNLNFLFKENDLKIISLKIKEIYNENKQEFSYKIKINHNNYKNIDLFIKLTQDKNNINASIHFDNFYNNITYDIIFAIMSNYYKVVYLEQTLKPLISDISHHSFVLNII